jgi:hypothetical protein
MDYFVGLDLGQVSDFSALAVVGRSERFSCGCGEGLLALGRGGDRTCPTCGGARAAHYAVRYLKRWPLGTSYPQIVRDVAELLERPPLSGCQLAVDATGVGRAVVDLFRQARLPAQLVPITITAGHQATYQRDGWHVAKKHLAGAMQVLLQNQRLKVSEVPERETLLKELRNFRVKVTAAANEIYEAWRESDKDDLVLAVALPCWLAERGINRPAFRVLPLGPRGPHERRASLRIVVCPREHLSELAIDPRHNCLLVTVTDPGTPPPDPPGGFRPLASLALEFADLDPAEHEATWGQPVPPWGRLAGELAMSREIGRRLWSFLTRRRDPAADVIVLCGDQRLALSMALALCDTYRVPREETICIAGEEDWRAGKEDQPPSRHVYETTRESRALVV